MMIRTTEIIIWLAYLISSYFLIFWLLVFLEENTEEHTGSSKLKKLPFVSVVIPAYNEQGTIAQTITKTLGLDYPKEKLEVIVVNDGSKDNTRQIVESLITKYVRKGVNCLKLINQKNKGKGAALNNALKKARGEFFVVLDADSYPQKDALMKLLPHFTRQEIATVLPLMKLKEAKNILQKIQWCEYLINFFYKKLMGLLDCIHVAPGPFSVYRKKVLISIGGFDENNLTEDLEISLRLQKNNYKLIQTFDTIVYTPAPTTIKSFYNQRNRWYKGSIINMVRYRRMAFARKYGDFGLLQVPRVLTAGFLAILLVSIALFNFIQPWARRIYDLKYVNFDVLMFLRNINLSFSYLDFNYQNLYFAMVVFVFGMIIIYLAHKYTKEKWTKHGKVTVPAYLILYSLLISIVWIGIFIDFVRGRIQKW